MSVYGMVFFIVFAVGVLGFVCAKKAQKDEKAKG